VKAHVKIILAGSVCLLAMGGFFFATGVFSRPRDFSSPSVRIRIVDQGGAPMSGVEVGRNWYDSDLGRDGSEVVRTDSSGAAEFARVPARVGLFTGGFRKALTSLGPCGPGSGTLTTVYVRCAGRSEVAPKNRLLHQTGQTFQDSEGITFNVSTDSLSNTMAFLSFPRQTTAVDYVLSVASPGR
jgi:hypothetical protein